MTFQRLREQAIGCLGLSLMEYYGRTIFEISIELDGYNVRWEENRSLWRWLWTLIHNVNVSKKDRKKEYEAMPLPSEYDYIRRKNKVKEMRESKQFLKELKGRGDGRSGTGS